MKSVAQRKRERERRDGQGERSHAHRGAVAEHAIEQRRVHALDPPHDPNVLRVLRGRAQARAHATVGHERQRQQERRRDASR